MFISVATPYRNPFHSIYSWKGWCLLSETAFRGEKHSAAQGAHLTGLTYFTVYIIQIEF